MRKNICFACLFFVRLREFAGEERGAVGGGGERKCLPLLLEP